jgi:membrane protein DedA with SNARE-associated domain
MNKKQIISIIVAILGVVLIIFAIHSQSRVDSAESNFNAVTAPFSSTPAGGMVRRSGESKIEGYNREIRWLMIAGVVIVVAGGIYWYTTRKKKR